MAFTGVRRRILALKMQSKPKKENKGCKAKAAWLKENLLQISAAIFLALLGVAALTYFVKSICTCSIRNEAVLSTVINSFVAALGFSAIYISVQNDREIKRFEYIEDYNFNFLTNKEFTDVERKLETCYQKYKRIDERNNTIWNDEDKKEFEDHCDLVFGTVHCLYSDELCVTNSRIGDNNLISEDYQKLINYLVYLESFVPLIIHKQIRLEEVDDLFGYRYFIAVNNPVMQKNELLREQKYYQGCIKEYGEWKGHRSGDIPMKEYDLEEALKNNNKTGSKIDTDNQTST